jgi:hypothetical protein
MTIRLSPNTEFGVIVQLWRNLAVALRPIAVRREEDG